MLLRTRCLLQSRSIAGVSLLVKKLVERTRRLTEIPSWRWLESRWRPPRLVFPSAGLPPCLSAWLPITA